MRQARPWVAGGLRMLGGVNPVLGAVGEYAAQRVEDPAGATPTDWPAVAMAGIPVGGVIGHDARVLLGPKSPMGTGPVLAGEVERLVRAGFSREAAIDRAKDTMGWFKNMFVHTIRDPQTLEQIGWLETRYHPTTKTLSIESMRGNTRGYGAKEQGSLSNLLGPRGIRDIATYLQESYPDATRVRAGRVGGTFEKDGLGKTVTYAKTPGGWKLESFKKANE